MSGGVFIEAGGWSCSGGQILGDRSEQQDEIGALAVSVDGEDGVLLALADGMGGHEGGALAAKLAVASSLVGFEQAAGPVPSRLDAGLKRANDAILHAKKDTPSSLADMGCTLVLAFLTGDQAWYLSVGDSLVVLAAGDRMRQVNQDHSMAPFLDELVRTGDLTAAEAARDPRRHQLLSALTGRPIPLIDRPDEPLHLPAGARLVLASDGLVAASLSEVAHILLREDKVANQAQALLASARSAQAQGLDNTSVIVCARAAPVFTSQSGG